VGVSLECCGDVNVHSFVWSFLQSFFLAKGKGRADVQEVWASRLADLRCRNSDTKDLG
jgi:hypothetical protein